MSTSITPVTTNQDRLQKIVLEKRKRHQAYMALDYLLSVVTYFDFFSFDAFTIVKNAKYLGQITNKNISLELLLLPYFYFDSQVSIILENTLIKEKLINELLEVFPDMKRIEKESLPLNSMKTFLKKIFCFVKKEIFIFFEKELKIEENLSNDINYSFEVSQIFEKAAKNSLTRFKTPVITSEILFITIMEEKSTKVSKIFRSCFENEVDWYIFRYKLIKYIHSQESALRTGISKNQQYFAYLLKTQLTDSEFNFLIKNSELQKSVSIFRNILILKVLEVDIFETISEDIYQSMKNTKNKRRYSSP